MKQKIRVDRILARLQAHIMHPDGTMQPSAVTAALGLLRKVMPDLQSVDMKGKLEGRDLRQYSEAELVAIIDASAVPIADQVEQPKPALLPAPEKNKNDLH